MKSNNPPVVSREKRDIITSNYFEILSQLKEHRKKHKEIAISRKIDLSRPAWVRVSSAPPVDNNYNSYRLCLGFQNVGCKYRENDPHGLGCLICGYYASTAFKVVDPQIISEQFKTGLRYGCKTSIGFNSIEFLNDGSFLNPDEFNIDSQELLFDLLAQMPHIKRVLVESRPEYVSATGINFLLKKLRFNQLLEIGIGLESVDNFVREICINKGFTISDFEKSLDTVSTLDKKELKRIHIVSYLIVKPAFLSQSESVDDILNSLKYLCKLNSKYPFQVIAKLEPAAIADGTVLSMLHESQDPIFHYEPLNYWAILEIIARFASEIKDKEFRIRVGAREDMDDVLKAPAIYNSDGETFHPFDFVVYESIQKFNQHQNYFRLFAVIGEVYNSFNDSSITNESSSMMEWLSSNNITSNAIVDFFKNNLNLIQYQLNNEETKNEIEMMHSIYSVLDILEGYNKNNSKLNRQIQIDILNNDKVSVESIIMTCFDLANSKLIIKVDIIEMKINFGFAELFFDVTNLLLNEKTSVWSRFPINNCNN